MLITHASEKQRPVKNRRYRKTLFGKQNIQAKLEVYTSMQLGVPIICITRKLSTFKRSPKLYVLYL